MNSLIRLRCDKGLNLKIFRKKNDTGAKKEEKKEKRRTKKHRVIETHL